MKKVQLSRQLHESAMGGDINQVLELLHDHRQELDINWTNYDGDTALLAAVGYSKSEIAYLLIEAGADLNISNRHGSYPLLEAAAARNEILFKLLIRSGANVNVKTRSGTTPLLMAVKNFSSSIVKLCLDNHANVDDQNRYGHTPLIQAILEGKHCLLNKVQMLTEAGADKDIQQRDGNTAVMLAAIKNQHPVMKHLLDTQPPANINLANTSGQTLLAIAAKHYGCEFVNRLLDLGADLQHADVGGYTPLIWSALSGNEKVMDVLIKRGSNVDAQTKAGWTALMHATRLRNRTTVKMLALRSNLNLTNDDGESAIFHATYSAKVMILLIEEGADINIRNKDNQNILEIIESNSNLESRHKATVLNIVRTHDEIAKNGKWRRRKQFVLMWYKLKTRRADHEYNEKLCQLLDVYDMAFKIASYI